MQLINGFDRKNGPLRICVQCAHTRVVRVQVIKPNAYSGMSNRRPPPCDFPAARRRRRVRCVKREPSNTFESCAACPDIGCRVSSELRRRAYEGRLLSVLFWSARRLLPSTRKPLVFTSLGPVKKSVDPSTKRISIPCTRVYYSSISLSFFGLV